MDDLTIDQTVLFVLSVSYTAPIQVIEEHLEDHRDWLDGKFKDGTFLASGPKVPRSGGIILARGISLEELKALVADDPFVLAKIARYEFTAFEPTRGPLSALLLDALDQNVGFTEPASGAAFGARES